MIDSATALIYVVVSHCRSLSATLAPVPTTQPRYTVTDTGETAELLDLAQRAWPEVTDRRQLLLRLATAGGEAVREQLQRQGERAERQRVGLARASELVDVEKLLGDDAWR